MRYTPRSRDRYKNLLALVTGLATFGTVAATGAATGLAARQTAVRDEQRAQADGFAAAQARAAAARSVAWQPTGRTLHLTRTRPARTVVVTRVVHAASTAGVASVGGGSVSAPAPVAASRPGTSSYSAPAPAPAPRPAPAPAPAPSSGS